MIDYIKILIINVDVQRLLNLPFLEFNTKVSEKTGELSSKKVAEYNYCKISLFDNGVVLFTGSIHKLYNSVNGIKAPNYKKVKQYKGFNGNQFTIANIIEIKKHLQTLFDCGSEQMAIQNIELGVNTTLKVNPELYLKGLLYHKNKLFEYRYNGNLAQAQHQRFIFKIYNKSNQYAMMDHTLRIELKIIKIEQIKNIGLKTFADINTKTLQRAEKMLLDRFDEVMHYDYTIDKKKLSKNQKKYLIKYSNPRYWIYELKPNYRFRHKKRLLEITRNNSQKLHQKIRVEIQLKCSIINRLSENPNCSIINRSSIGLNMLQTTFKKSNGKLINKKQIICPITGITLSLEKDGSKYIKTSSLNYLHNQDQNKFIEICSLLLNKTNGNQPKYENGIISHLAKQVRNRFYNPISLKQTGYNQKKYLNQLELFTNI